MSPLRPAGLDIEFVQEEKLSLFFSKKSIQTDRRPPSGSLPEQVPYERRLA